ncbi:hypothetical protein MMG85_06750 [Pseudoxanthomonas sp. LH2527]|uniref:hypothetical protein n=1 Tax=Pseudoxanthomonas sp. LH2527 TaxID=2923249 RepID=UPI001F12E143|nr:hypothetical protein [Pseudoxanthomonas sp. LH2527]MCH6483264.1 hypothetical protein [Pseudoxanthomonas sp. LH2527]
MSWIRKSFLGPRRSVPCDACGRLVSVHRLSVLAFFPTFASFIVVRDLWPSPVSVVVPAVALLLAGLVQVFMVPLVPRDA